MVFTNDGVHIPSQYQALVEVFSNTVAETLRPHQSLNHVIDLQPYYKLPYGGIYNQSKFELKMFKAYIKMNIAHGFVQQSSLAAASPILFAKKKDGGLRLCADYSALNTDTVQHR
jgi:hypothetical protein